MKDYIKRVKLMTLMFGFLLASILPSILAGTTASAQQSASLSINPKKNYTIEPGKTIKDTLVIRNIDKKHKLNLRLRVVDFTYTDKSGAPKLMLDENAPETTWSLRPFMKVPETVTIEPNSSKTVDMSISIPKNQGAGSFYSAIVYSSGSGGGVDEGTVGLNASGVTLAFVDIPGKVHEDLTLKQLGAFNGANTSNADGYKFFNFTEPLRIGYTLENKGNVAESPNGTITIKPLIGAERQINSINPNGSLALIGQTRTFLSCIKLKKEAADFNGKRSEENSCVSAGLWPNIYKVKLAIVYGQNGNNNHDIAGSAYFIYAPWWAIAIVVLVLALLIYHGRRFYKYAKSKRSKKSYDNKKDKKTE